MPEDQLTLASGKEGRNVRLAAQLTGWKIDIKTTDKPKEEATSAEDSSGEPKEEAGEKPKKRKKKEEVVEEKVEGEPADAEGSGEAEKAPKE